MNPGDTVRVRPQFHRPSRIGHVAKIVTSRSVGEAEHNLAIQHFVIFQIDGLPDWINEYDLELIEESHEYDVIIDSLSEVQEIIMEKVIQENKSNVGVNNEGRRVLNL